MRLRELFRFELGYQARSVTTWIFLALLFGVSLLLAVESFDTNDGYHFNAPFMIAATTVIMSMLGLLVPVAFGGAAGARDASSRTDPLTYTLPLSKATYLGGRFLAALALSGAFMLAVPVSMVVALVIPAHEPGTLLPFDALDYVGAYLLVGLPNAFICTALAFSLAVATRRAIAGYVVGGVIFFATMLSWTLLATVLGHWTLAKLTDPLGMTAMAELADSLTAAQKDANRVWLAPSLLKTRALWTGIAGGVLALTWWRFRFAHPAGAGGSLRAQSAADGGAIARATPISVPRVARSFGARTRAWQVWELARESVRVVLIGWGGVVVGALGVLVVLMGPELMEHIGVPLVPTTAKLTDYIGQPGDLFGIVVPVIAVFYAGELVWREREAAADELADTAPVSDAVRVGGRFLGLALALVALQALILLAQIIVQVRLGHFDFELGVYLPIVFGLQLVDWLFIAVLALAVHVIVAQKYLAHLIVLLGFAFMLNAPEYGVEHRLLVYAADPGWSYSDMRGFEPTVAPWLAFNAYWAAWALLLAGVTRLFWQRGRETAPRARAAQARRRFTGRAAYAAAGVAALVLATGGFVFWNTNVRNVYRTGAEGLELRAEYERRYGRWADAPRPDLVAARLEADLHPGDRRATISGTYVLVNTGYAAVDTLHVGLPAGMETRSLYPDRRHTVVVRDDVLRHTAFALAAPLLPGDTLRLDFEVAFAPRGFGNGGADDAVVGNGTYIEHDRLPVIGYVAVRELADSTQRATHGLPPRTRGIARLDDAAALARAVRVAPERVAIETVVSTAAGQLALAPGRLMRAWTEAGRHRFHYVTDAPIRWDFALYSADYAVGRDAWNGVELEVVHHPAHAWNVDGMLRALRASLAYMSGRFGAYPHGQLRLVERPGGDMGLHASAINVSYLEGFSLMRPERDARDVDFPFAIVAHEVAHQWWGHRLYPARAEGAALLSESLAWYSALAVVEETYGETHLERLMGVLRAAYLSPRPRGDVPLLRADDWYLAYRKGPFAMRALREYAGADVVDGALRALIERHGPTGAPLATSLDLYGALRAAVPDSLHGLLHDLFAENTYWELETKRVEAEPRPDGTWRVALDVSARKFVVDTTGVERHVAMDENVEIGVYAKGGEAPLYLGRHRIRTGEQRVEVTVAREPARAGIDPRHLLIDTDPWDNVAEVQLPDRPAPAPAPRFSADEPSSVLAATGPTPAS